MDDLTLLQSLCSPNKHTVVTLAGPAPAQK